MGYSPLIYNDFYYCQCWSIVFWIGLFLIWFHANFDLSLSLGEGFPVIMVSTSLSIAIGKGGIQSYTSNKSWETKFTLILPLYLSCMSFYLVVTLRDKVTWKLESTIICPLLDLASEHAFWWFPFLASLGCLVFCRHYTRLSPTSSPFSTLLRFAVNFLC